MGALTLKTFPFELRGWDLEKFNSVDPTDSFGTKIKISLNNKQIIQIEPVNNWIHDKSRQFFDSLKNTKLNTNRFFNSWNYTIKTLIKTIYLFELCNFKLNFINFFIVVYENLSLNLFSLLSIYNQKYSFLKIKKADNKKLNNNLEFNFLLNKKLNFNQSTLCFLISTNSRFESSLFNLKLKQRILKGNFKCFMIGSLINLTYNFKYVGATTPAILKKIAEGIHFVCQDFKISKKPVLIFNSEQFKRNDNKNLNKMILYISFLNNLKFGLNTLNSTIFETGVFYLNSGSFLKNSDFKQFSSVYFINTTTYNNNNINKILKTNLLYSTKKLTFLIKKSFFNQNFYKNEPINNLLNKKLDKYLYVPIKNFFETNQILINTQGLIKTTNLVVKKNKLKSSWKLIRNLFNLLKKNLIFLNIKTNLKINLKIQNNIFKNFVNLKFKAISNLNQKLFYNNNINCFIIIKKRFKIKKIKFINTKIKFWLNDFFTGGREEFSKHSLTLIKCSNAKKLQTTNFF